MAIKGIVVSPIGAAALKSREADKLVAYRDSKGIWTISVGVTSMSGLINVTPGLRITQAQSDALYAKAIELYAEPVRAALSRLPDQNEFDAFVSICYNIGATAFRTSTFVRRFNAGDRAGCAEAIMMWRKPPEIITRRTAERDQFLTPYAKSLPRGRSNDARPIPRPANVNLPLPGPVPDAIPPLAAPVTPVSPAPPPAAQAAPNKGSLAFPSQQAAKSGGLLGPLVDRLLGKKAG